MIEITGDFFDNKNSKKQEVKLRFLDDKKVLIIFEDETALTVDLSELSFSSRLANTPRIIKSKDFTIHTQENDKIDALLKEVQPKNTFLHILESKNIFAITSLVFIILLAVFFLTTGSSFLAKKVAFLTPHFIEKKISKATLQTMDKYILQKSTLSDKEKEQVLEVFKKVTKNDPKYHLYFRRGIGENAFALPGGDMVITDELVKFSDGDTDMLFGVLAHEKAHIVYKHSMQMLIKASLISTIITYFTGDTSTLATTLSTSLLQAKYSREFEKEADNYAKNLMLENNISPKHLANFFIKMQKLHKEGKRDGYFASHPSNDERIKELLKR